MKNKKLLSLVCTAAISLSALGAALSGCGEKHEHEVGKWTTSVGREPTCVAAGEEQGECTVCGDIVVRDMPADPADLAKHDYGEWTVTKPTATAKGSAVKTCSRGCTQNHERTVELPVLGDSSYTVKTVKQATINEDGEKSYTLADPAGEITFTEVVPKLQISSVGDAIAVGVYNAGEVREMNAHILGESLYSDYIKNHPAGREASCYFGNDYVHVVDVSEYVDDWYSYDAEGKVFGIRTSNRTEDGGVLTESVTATPNNMKGFEFSLGYSEISGKFGAEGLLKGLHDYAIEHVLNYSEKLASANNGEYEFSFDVVTVTVYNEVTVKFKLDDTGMLKELFVEELAYERYKFNLSTGEYEKDGDGEFILEENGKAAVAHYAGFISLTQTKKQATDVVPENNYDYRQRYVRSFNITHNKKTVGSEPVVVGANANEKFEFTDVMPTSASLDYDKPQLFLRKESRDVPLTLSDEEGIMGFYNEGDNSFNIRTTLTGEVLIVVKTRGMELFGESETVIKLNVTKLAPSQQAFLVTEYYEYNDASGSAEHSWVQIANGGEIGVEDELYVGQTLVFRLGMDGENEEALKEAGYVDLSFTSKVYKRNAEDANENTTAATLYDVAADSEEGGLYDGQVVKFVASEPGRYTLRLYSALQTDWFRYIVINVSDKPDYSKYFANGASYTCRIEEPEEENVELTFTNSGDWTAGEYTVTVAGSKTAVFTYSVNATTGEITCAYKSGVKDVDTRTDVNRYDFSLAFNEAYRLELLHPTGFVDIDGDNVTVLTESRTLNPVK